MTRRGLLSTLLGAATLDPERLLWVPGKKVISIPNPVVVSTMTYVFREVYDPRTHQILFCLQATVNGNVKGVSTIRYGTESDQDKAKECMYQYMKEWEQRGWA